MKTVNKITSILLTLFLTAGLFSCTKPEPDPTPEAQPSQTESTESPESEETTPETEPPFTLDMEDFTMQEPTDKLTVYVDSMNGLTINPAVEIFRELYPDVEVEVISYGDDEYMEILKTELAAGGGPDLVYAMTSDLQDFYKTMSSGIFLNLDQLISRDEDFNLDDYVSGVIDAGMLNGRRYFFPVSYSAHPMLTTEENLTSEGLTKDDISTFDGFYSAIMAYQEKYAADDAKTTISYEGVVPNRMLLHSFLRNSGIPIIDYENNTVGIVTDPEAKAAFRTVMDCMKAMYDPEGDINKGYIDMADVKELENGGCFLFDSTYYDTVDGIGFSKDWIDLLNDGCNPVIVNIPDMNDGVSARISNLAAIPKGSKNQINAYRLLKIILSEEIQFSGSAIDYILVGTPVLKSAVEKKVERDYKKFGELDEKQLQLLTEYAQNADAGYFIPQIVLDYVREEMTPYINGTKTYEECYDRLVNVLTLYKDE